MAHGRPTSGRRVRRALLGLIAGSLAGLVLLGHVDGSSGTSALTSALVPACAMRERAVDLSAARRPLLSSPDARDPQLTASLVKLLVVAEVLAAGATPEDLALAERAATSSDDGAMSALWVRHGGAALVTTAAARLGLIGTGPPARAGQWGQSLMSAQDVATTLGRLGEVYGVGAAATVTGWLRATTPTAADGFSQLFGLLSPTTGAEGPVAAKQGWMCCVDGRRQLHSAGVLADGRTVVLLGDFPATVPWSTAVAALDGAAAAVVAGTAPRPGNRSGP